MKTKAVERLKQEMSTENNLFKERLRERNVMEIRDYITEKCTVFVTVPYLLSRGSMNMLYTGVVQYRYYPVLIIY